MNSWARGWKFLTGQIGDMAKVAWRDTGWRLIKTFPSFFKSTPIASAIPNIFFRFWGMRKEYDIIYGYRVRRQDGGRRILASILLKLTLLVFAGVYCVDANVPFRLMKAGRLQEKLNLIPGNFFLSNIALAVLLSSDKSWKHASVPIHKCNPGRTLDCGRRQEMDFEHMKSGSIWIKLWILFVTWAVLTGWALSFFHQLTCQGYIVVAVLALFFLVKFSPVNFKAHFPQFWARRKRWKRALPAIYLSLLFLAFLGGVIYQPNNYDYLTYRFSRILHWSWEGHWYWIDTINNRMNYSAPLFEWLMLPLFVFFKTDRFFFLINFASFLLLPGLVFSVFRSLGVGTRAAWILMWLLPSGYCYVIQAGSVGNDSFATVFLLAALYFAFRAKWRRSRTDFYFSILSMGLLTGAKASNLPLLLPCLVALAPSFRLCFGRPILTILILVAAAGVSFLPMAVINQKYTGHWSGDPGNFGRMQLADPVAGILGNTIQLALGSWAPPIFPQAGWWNSHAPQWLPETFRDYLQKGFPRLSLNLGELPVEEMAGLGLGVTSTLAFLIFYRCLKGPNRTGLPGRIEQGILWAGGIALLAYMAKMGSESAARITATYYPLVIAGLFVFLRLKIPRGIFSWFLAMATASSWLVVILTPARPLAPVLNVVEYLKKAGIDTPLLQRVEKVYSIYSARADILEPVRKGLPEAVKKVGFIQTGDDSEVSLWKPWGSRCVVDWKSDENAEWVVASSRFFVGLSNESLESWAERNQYKITSKFEITSKVQEGPVEWVIMRRQ